MPRRQLLQTLALALSLLPNLLGCGAAPPDRTLQNEPAPSAVSSTTPAPDPGPTTPGEKLIPRPCPTASMRPELPHGSALRNPVTLGTYLTQGGSISELRSSLAEAGLLPREGLGLVQADFNGDGWLDTALGLAEPEQQDGKAGDLHVFLCREDQFVLVSHSGRSIEGAPAVIDAGADFNGDGSQDLLVTWRRCGAHTCFVHTALLMWHAGEMQDRFEGSSDDLPSPEIEVLEPGDKGTLAIQITGHGVASVGAGPPRRVRRIWRWDATDSTYKPEADVALSSNFRIHALHDADAAARAGDYETALAGYRRVIEGDDLEDWGPSPQSRESLMAFATFRLLHTLLILEEYGQAAETLDSLRSDHLEEASGSAYRELAQVFWGAFQSSADVDEACRVVLDHVDADPPRYLEPLYYGYANPVYEAADLCPVAG